MILVLIAFLVLSCGDKKGVPAGILSHEKMVNILIGVHIGEGKVIQKGLPHDSAVKLFSKFQDSLFTKNQVTRKQFEKSYSYYSTHIEQLNEVYASVVDSLSLREAREKID